MLRSGKVRAIGISINDHQPANALKALATGLIGCVQVIYNIFDQSPEDELFPACQRLNVGVIARVPFDEGSLTGTLTAETRFPADDWRAKYFLPENLRPTVARVEKLKRDLPSGVALPELALRFILTARAVSTVIPGMRSTRHVEANLGASDSGPLPPGVLGKLRSHRWDRVPQPWSD